MDIVGITIIFSFCAGFVCGGLVAHKTAVRKLRASLPSMTEEERASVSAELERELDEFTEEEAKQIRAGKCPDCGGEGFLAGPSAGICQNIKCATCSSKFNVSPLHVERIG